MSWSGCSSSSASTQLAGGVSPFHPQLPSLLLAQPRQGTGGSAREPGSAASNWGSETGSLGRSLEELEVCTEGTGVSSEELEGSAAGKPGVCSGDARGSGGEMEGLQRGAGGVSRGEAGVCGREAGVWSGASGCPAGSPRSARGGRPVAGLSPASRRRQPGTSAGTAGAAGPRGRPRRCRGPGRWRAGPGRTGGGTTASRRRVGRGEAAAGRRWRLRCGSAPALGISSPPAAFINPSPDVRRGRPPRPAPPGVGRCPGPGAGGGRDRGCSALPCVGQASTVPPRVPHPQPPARFLPKSPPLRSPRPSSFAPSSPATSPPERRWGARAVRRPPRGSDPRRRGKPPSSAGAKGPRPSAASRPVG